MKHITSLFIIANLIIGNAFINHAQTKQSSVMNAPPRINITAQANSRMQANSKLQTDTALQAVVNQAIAAARARFPTLKEDELAVTLIDLTNNLQGDYKAASYRGNEPIYPASVVKMFYMVAAHNQMQDGKLKDTAELRRAMKDMIVDSSNDATHYVLDVVTDTTSGAELTDADAKTWAHKRNAVNRYFASQGYERINANQKPWCEAPYGRDKVFVTDATQSSLKGASNNRNMLTTDATARLLANIATGKAVSAERSKQMMELMHRDFAGESSDADDQAHGFTGIALSDAKYASVKLWSKAGWTSATRHDAAYIELPNKRKFVLVTYTEKHANEREIIPTVARVVIAEMMK